MSRFFGVIVNCVAVSYRALVCFGQQQCTISTEMRACMLPTAMAPYWLPRQRKPELPAYIMLMRKLLLITAFKYPGTAVLPRTHYQQAQVSATCSRQLLQSLQTCRRARIDRVGRTQLCIVHKSTNRIRFCVLIRHQTDRLFGLLIRRRSQYVANIRRSWTSFTTKSFCCHYRRLEQYPQYTTGAELLFHCLILCVFCRGPYVLDLILIWLIISSLCLNYC